MRSNKLTIHSL